MIVAATLEQGEAPLDGRLARFVNARWYAPERATVTHLPIAANQPHYNAENLEVVTQTQGLVAEMVLEVIEKLQEHDPGQQRQAVEVAIEALVLAHDVARRLEQAAQGLGGGEWGSGLFLAGHGPGAMRQAAARLRATGLVRAVRGAGKCVTATA